MLPQNLKQQWWKTLELYHLEHLINHKNRIFETWVLYRIKINKSRFIRNQDFDHFPQHHPNMRIPLNETTIQ